MHSSRWAIVVAVAAIMSSLGLCSRTRCSCTPDLGRAGTVHVWGKDDQSAMRHSEMGRARLWDGLDQGRGSVWLQGRIRKEKRKRW